MSMKPSKPSGIAVGLGVHRRMACPFAETTLIGADGSDGGACEITSSAAMANQGILALDLLRTRGDY
jgi:hypothetical protein